MNRLELPEPPRLAAPTVSVRHSWIEAETAEPEPDGTRSDLLKRALDDFPGLVAARQGTPTIWEVPTTILWYTAGPIYVGEIVIRHRLTPKLTESGGHIGYSVAKAWRRQGHATRMLSEGLENCRQLELTSVLLTCKGENEASRKVIMANGGVADGTIDGEDRFWIDL